MTFAHEAIVANPVSGNVDKAAQRAMFTRRYTYNLSAAELASDFVAVDPATGVLPLYLRQNNVTYQLDPLDTTTSYGAGVCLVTSDGKRYKAETIEAPWSVLDKDTTAQPVSPTEGDRYLIPNGATGTDWAGKDGKVGIFVGGAWHFATIPIGRLLYIEDETSFYHRNPDGNWTAGLGDIVLGASSVPITAIIGAKASFVVKVENQTTTTAPSSPVAPVAYIVAGSGGAWSGYSVGDLAMCMVDGSWTRIVPIAGDEVYDRARAINYKRNSANTAWVSAVGSIVGFDYEFTQGTGSVSNPGSGAVDYSMTVAPVTTTVQRLDDVYLSYAAKAPGNLLCFTYSAFGTVTAVDQLFTAGLLRGNASGTFETTAIAWDGVIFNTNLTQRFPTLRFIVAAADIDVHRYKIGFFRNAAGNYPSSLQHRLFEVNEIVP